MLGILNINKPAGMTSRAVVTRVSRIVGRKVKCGHAGTLDPLATGVLVACLGRATKLVPFIHDHLKSYEGKFLLGKQSPTDDIEGEMTDIAVPEDLSAEKFQRVFPDFIGQITQVPPTHSAIWINGERAYKLARKGEKFEVPSRDVWIESLELSNFTPETFSLKMTCGTGTYVRSIGRDIAEKLGTAATMSELVRTSVGPFALQDAVELEQLDRDTIEDHLESPLTALSHLPQIEIDQHAERTLRYGQRIRPELCSLPSSATQYVLTDGMQRLIAIAERREDEFAPQIVFPELD